MVSPLLKGFVLCVEQRCSESASKKYRIYTAVLPSIPLFKDLYTVPPQMSLAGSTFHLFQDKNITP
jgi:hypothetical protein